MKECWLADPSQRPPFRSLGRTVDSIRESKEGWTHTSSTGGRRWWGRNVENMSVVIKVQALWRSLTPLLLFLSHLHVPCVCYLQQLLWQHAGEDSGNTWLCDLFIVHRPSAPAGALMAAECSDTPEFGILWVLFLWIRGFDSPIRRVDSLWCFDPWIIFVLLKAKTRTRFWLETEDSWMRFLWENEQKSAQISNYFPLYKFAILHFCHLS